MPFFGPWGSGVPSAPGGFSNGQREGAWAEVSQEYVSLVQLNGRILEIARQLYETATHNILCRYNSVLTRSCRFVIDGQVYSIGWVEMSGLQWMRATVEEAWSEGGPT